MEDHYDFYVAGPFFNGRERDAVDAVVNKLRNCPMHWNVYSPKEHKIPDGEHMANPLWAKKVFNMDKEAIHKSTALISLNWGLYSDSGTAWETGYAFALGKPTFTIICGDLNVEDYSLMCINGTDCAYTLEDFLTNKNTHYPLPKINQK